MKQSLNIPYNIHYRKTAEEDWAESWKAFFKPEIISARMVVKPTWQEYREKPDEIILEIDPGMAFGTGTHPTTVLCLQMIERYLKPGDTFLDVGTGSGILMVAAAKLGASRMLGIDKDKTAVDVATSNLLRNNISSEVFQTQTGHLLESVKDRYQIVVANILTEPILILLEDLESVLLDAGIFILSGITDDNARRVRDRTASLGFEHLETRHQEDWVAIVGRWIEDHSISNSFHSNQ
jgi:ribosomal protein L11 methyltransferase